LLTLLSTHGAAQEEFFAEGNRLYQDGDYAGAVERYERIVEAGYDSGALRYNIGNAYFKLGDLGKAILNYERSLRLSPRDEDARANLELARSLTVDQVTPLPGFWLFRVANWWVHLLSRGLLTILVAAAYLMTTAATVVFVLRRGSPLAAWCARLAVVAGAVTVVFAINLAAIDLGIGVSEEAVVMVDEVAVPVRHLTTVHSRSLRFTRGPRFASIDVQRNGWRSSWRTERLGGSLSMLLRRSDDLRPSG
jgi:hypothetical protein